MPKPTEGESEKDFIGRCMAYPDMQKYDQKQRSAICYSIWREAKGIAKPKELSEDYQLEIDTGNNRVAYDGTDK